MTSDVDCGIATRIVLSRFPVTLKSGSAGCGGEAGGAVPAGGVVDGRRRCADTRPFADDCFGAGRALPAADALPAAVDTGTTGSVETLANVKSNRYSGAP